MIVRYKLIVRTCSHLAMGAYVSSVMMAKNSCSLISPSWSRSNSSIIACLKSKEYSRVSKGEIRRGLVHAQFIVLQPVPNFLGHPPQVLQVDLPRVIVIEKLEGASYLLHRVPREYLLAH